MTREGKTVIIKSMAKQALLRELPSVDEVIKSPYGERWLEGFPRRYVLQAVREVIEERRRLILEGEAPAVAVESMAVDIEARLKALSSLSLRPVINATGIVIHTNLGRAVLSRKAIENIIKTASGYCNLEYDLQAGARGRRNAHLKRLLREVTGAEDGIAVNNNAGAVLLCLNALAKGREVIVSRGELVEIGGSFRIPDVMSASGAILKEVGTTNKTHLWDYERAINENTALILKVHRSNYRITGFTEDVPVELLSKLGRENRIPLMFDMGSGCLIDIAPNIAGEPTVQSALKAGADIATFSGDKLLGGPQAGIIAGAKRLIESIEKNPLQRALRIDKLTLSALEATLLEYIDGEKAVESIPTLRMLLEGPDKLRQRAKRAAALLRKHAKAAEVTVIEDFSQAGGGALPEVNLKTYAVAIRPKGLTPNRLDERLRKGDPPVIGRIKDNAFLLDMRTVGDHEVKTLAGCLRAALSG